MAFIQSNISRNDYRETMEQQINSLRKQQDRDRYPLEETENAIVHGKATQYGYIQLRNKTITGSDSSFPPDKLKYLNCSKGSRYTEDGQEKYRSCSSESSGYNVGANHSAIKQADIISTYSFYEGVLYKTKMEYDKLIEKNSWYPDINTIKNNSEEYNKIMQHIYLMNPSFNPNNDNMTVTIYEELIQQGNTSLYNERVQSYRTAYTSNKTENSFIFKAWNLSSSNSFISGEETPTDQFDIKDTILQDKNAFWTRDHTFAYYYDSDGELVNEPWENDKEYSQECAKINFKTRAFSEKNLKLIYKQGIPIGTGGFIFSRCGSYVSNLALFGKNPGMHRFRGCFVEISIGEKNGVQLFDYITKCGENKKIQADAYASWDKPFTTSIYDHIDDVYQKMNQARKEESKKLLNSYKDKFNIEQIPNKKIKKTDLNHNEPLKHTFNSKEEIQHEIQKTEQEKKDTKSTNEETGLWKSESGALPSIMKLYIEILKEEIKKLDDASTPARVSRQASSRAPARASSQEPAQAPARASSQEPARAPERASSQEPAQAPARASSQEPARAPSRAPASAPLTIPSKQEELFEKQWNSIYNDFKNKNQDINSNIQKLAQIAQNLSATW